MKNVSVLCALCSALLLAACAGSGDGNRQYAPAATPTVDYVESLDVYSAPHQDSFLNQLAMNYRSYAIYNARTSGYSEIGELFAQKAVAAFSGELPFPESLENWPVGDEELGFELHNSYNQLLDELKNDAADRSPEVAAEAQAKFDCWLSASASGQASTADECKIRFKKAMAALDCGGETVVPAKVVATTVDSAEQVETAQRVKTETYYPETRRLAAMNGAGHARDGVIIVNNVNVPEHLINPVPVQPMVFNQNIYGGDKTVEKSVSNSGNVSGNTAVSTECRQNPGECPLQQQPVPADDFVDMVDVVETAETGEIPMIGEELVTREEFINIMMAMRAELTAINARLDKIQAAQGDRTMIKVQQIPLEPKQHVMEEIFEIRFDFNKSEIKPEYRELIRKLASAAQENRNIKVSVVGHTDTSGSAAYNYALGGKRAEAVQKILVQNGIPASQIVSVSAGERDLKVQTGDDVRNADNRRVRVVKEVHYTEPATPAPIAVEVEEYSASDCGAYGCDQ
ncbi:MAG: OmpA family protein [Rickettsiales bacterium]|jgi:outer membrane protein OmpA-like peptidoglycan-associated protein|nr:OmpA family protein [Rickettsiales bacterium]